MSSCEEFELLANLAIDEEATLEELAELNAHLEACPDCRAYYGDINRIHGLFAQKEIAAPEGFAVRVMDRVRETEQDPPAKEKKVIPFPHWRQWAALAACCAVVVLSVWAVGSAVGVKGATTTVGDPPQASQDMRSTAQGAADHDGPAPLFEEDGTAVEEAGGEASDEDAPVLPEEYQDLAKAAAKDGAAEGGYQPLADGQPEQKPTLAAAAPPEHTEYTRDALPAANESDQDQAAASAEAEDDRFLEDCMDQIEQPSETEEMQEPEPPAPDPVEAPDFPETPENPEAPDSEPEVKEVKPVAVVNVPEPGILTAFGSAAQEWVEDVLGLEWAVGGSYPLSAEQYVDLLQTLDESGEPYLVQPGAGYCLMTE